MKFDSQLPPYYATTIQSGYNKKRLVSIASDLEETVELVVACKYATKFVELIRYLSAFFDISPSHWVRLLFPMGILKGVTAIEDASHVVVQYRDEIRSPPIRIKRSHGWTFVDFQYIRYGYREDSNCFARIAPIDFTRGPALNLNQVDARRQEYGSTPFSVHISASSASALFAIFKDQVILSPLIYFEGFCVFIWTFTKYTTYTFLIVSLVVVERFAAMRQSFHTWSHLLSISARADNQEVAVIRLDEEGFETSQTVHAKDLVPGDHISITPNMHIPCDCVLIKGEVIVDVSFVTGESRAVRCLAVPPGKASKVVTSSSLLLCGSKALRTRAPGGSVVCRAIVVASGFQTLQGNFLLSVLFRDPSPAEERVQLWLARSVGVLIALAVVCMTYTYFVSVSLSLDPTELTVRVFDILTDALPPALPLALSIATLAASFRLPLYVSGARSGRPTHMLAGLVNTVVLDKTNTITTSEMSVTGVLEAGSQTIAQVPGRGSHLEQAIAACTYLAVLDSGEIVGDPLEIALIGSIGWEVDTEDDSFIRRKTGSRPLSRAAGILSPVLEHTNADVNIDTLNALLQSDRTYSTNSIQVLASYPFNPVSMRMSVVARLTESDKLAAFSKGAFEQIISSCDPDSVPFTLADVHERLSGFGYRILAYSYKPLPSDAEPQCISRQEIESGTIFAGIVLLSNQLHPASKEAISQLRASNIKVFLCTGDSSGTATAVARQCGITGHMDPKDFIYGGSSTSLRDPLLIDSPVEASDVVFSRMSPDDKAMFVESLARKETVGAVMMCGDGPNDANALCAADVGLVVNATPNPLLESAAGCLVCLDQQVGLRAVVEVITHGRSSFAVSLCIAKIVIAYAVIEGTCVALCYSVGDNLTDLQYAVVDMFILLPTALLLATTVSPAKSIQETQSIPPFKVACIGLTFQCVVSLVWQITALQVLKDQNWYVPFQPSPRMLAGPLPWAHITTDLTGLENTALFIMCCFQCVLVIVLFASRTLKLWCAPLHELTLLNIWIKSLIVFVVLLVSGVTVLQDTYLGQWVMTKFDLVPLQGIFIFQFSSLVLTQSLISYLWEWRILPRIEREIVREYLK